MGAAAKGHGERLARVETRVAAHVQRTTEAVEAVQRCFQGNSDSHLRLHDLVEGVDRRASGRHWWLVGVVLGTGATMIASVAATMLYLVERHETLLHSFYQP